MAHNIYKDFTNSIRGLIALMTTYNEDTMFCCKIQTIIEHIQTTKIDFDKKYKLDKLDSPVFEDFSD